MNLGILGKLASYSTSSVPASFDAIHKEITAGLPNEKKRMDRARMARDYYEGDFEAYQTDYPKRLGVHDEELVHRNIPFVRAIVDAKIRRLYMSDPKRTIAKHPAATEYLESIYSKGRLTPKLKDSLKYAALGGVAAIQVEINEAKDEEQADTMRQLRRPAVGFRLWAADEFAVWCTPNEPLAPYAVAVIDKYDNQKRCRLWTPEVFAVYTTKKWDGSDATAGTQLYELVAAPEPNWLGTVPFFFQWWVQPTKEFWVWSPGEELVKVNQHANARLSKIADDTLWTRPVTYSRNVHESWKPSDRIMAGRIEKLPGIHDTIGDAIDGPSLETTIADLSYLKDDGQELDNYLDIQGELHGVPKEQWRNKSNGATSGVAILSEALPIIEFCEGQQVLMEDTERDGALLTLMTVSTYLEGNAVIDAAIKDFGFSTQWPPLTKNRPGPDYDAHLQFELVNAISSPVQVYQEMTGTTEEEAIEHFKQKARHDALLMMLAPMPAVDPNAPTDGTTDPKTESEPDTNDPAETSEPDSEESPQ